MILSPTQLVYCSIDAGIKVPKNLWLFEKVEYKYFYFFNNVQVGTPLAFPTCYCHNAHIISSIPEDKVAKTTWTELINYGFIIHENYKRLIQRGLV